MSGWSSSARAEVLTPRLVLTPVGPDDVDDLVVLYGDPLVAHWTGPWTRVSITTWAQGMAARWASDGVGKWMARHRSDSSLIGRGGFTRISLDTAPGPAPERATEPPAAVEPVSGIGAATGTGPATGVGAGAGMAGETVLELGWAVRDGVTGQGYATELGRAALAWAAERFPELAVVAFTEVHNRRSRAVMERLGLRHAGTVYREGLVEGRPGLHPDAPFALYRA